MRTQTLTLLSVTAAFVSCAALAQGAPLSVGAAGGSARAVLAFAGD